jgi:tRNA threonylcarbamoyladenosine biosynthesis protein TsaE
LTSFVTKSAAETTELGRALSSELRAGDVVAFYGELGAGKTTMIKGVAAGLGVSDVVKSPSFVIVTEYRGRVPVYHVDLYRLAQGVACPVSNVQCPVNDRGGQVTDAEFEGLGLEDYLGGDGVCLIEWAERAEKVLPGKAIRVRMSVEGSGRRIEIAGLRAPV